MKAKPSVLIIFLALFTGIGGFILGSAFPDLHQKFNRSQRDAPVPQSAPSLIAPSDGSEFVDSALELQWRWNAELLENQLYALRIWTGELAYREIWTVEDRVSVAIVIDSFSVEAGIFFWKVTVVNTDTKGNFESMGSEWSEQYSLRRVRRLSIPKEQYSEMSGIARQIHDQNLNPARAIDEAHRFIQKNSIPDLQQDYDADYGDAIALMFDYSQGRSSERPHLLCDGRSTAMLTILRELGIDSRLVFLYSPVPGYLAQHTVLEVFDPERQRWQVHDLAWDFYYVDLNSRERVSAERILFGPRENLAGCPIAGGACNAAVMQESIGYFDAMRYGWTFELWVNPDRFAISRRFEGQNGQNIAEFISGGYPQKVTVRMGNWENQVPQDTLSEQ
ncbi:MAG: transglutaminase domain-containing protein [Chloroflexi bacterium]|nr:transglutaminase domain-containing protein [Chloroflexota bacterium]